jgi:hypothetical protein
LLEDLQGFLREVEVAARVQMDFILAPVCDPELREAVDRIAEAFGEAVAHCDVVAPGVPAERGRLRLHLLGPGLHHPKRLGDHPDNERPLSSQTCCGICFGLARYEVITHPHSGRGR